MSDDLLGALKSGAETGAAVGSFGGVFLGILLFLRWMLNFIAGRTDARQLRLDRGFASYTRKIEDRCKLLEERCDRYEEEIEACHHDKRELAERVSKLEGHSTGVGDLRQNEQILRALETRIKKLEDPAQ